MKKNFLAVFAVMGAMLSGAAQAQYPNKPIRLLVPFAPGGSSDIVSRSFAAEMGKTLGQTIVVESKPGGAGNIAMQEVKGSAPDGYTIILGHVGTLAVNPAMFAKLPYDPVKDFVPITLLAKVPSLLVVNAEKMKAKKRHRLRLLNKKLCYSTEFLEELYPDKRFSKQPVALKYLRKAQKSLGRLNDDANRQSLAAAMERDGVQATLPFLGPKREKRLIRTAAEAYRKLTALKSVSDLRR